MPPGGWGAMCVGPRNGTILGGFFHFSRTQYLAMRAVAAHLGSRQYDFKAEM